MKTLHSDVVVVAAGPAGLAAAITAAENGKKTIVFEKMSTAGGAANMGMGLLGIDTHIQKRTFNDISVEEAFNLHMQYTHYRVDAELVQAYFSLSADTILWLEEMGVEFAGAFRYFRDSAATWHIVKPENGVIGPRAAGAMIKAMVSRAKELGVEIYYETPATDLIVRDGRVCGVKAVDAAGEQIEAHCKAVCVCTGGFGNNPEMIKEEFGLVQGKDFFSIQVPGVEGDGLRMMWKAGAQKYGLNVEVIQSVTLPEELRTLSIAMFQPNLLINQNGDRFMNEEYVSNGTFFANAIGLQPGRCIYSIFDGAIVRHYKKHGVDIVSLVHPDTHLEGFDSAAEQALQSGSDAFFAADTAEELAEKLGIAPEKLQDTLDEYNDMCACGVDSKFFKSHKYLRPITGRGKYYAGKIFFGAYGTLGGVRINKRCEVLDNENKSIPGLYSAGTDANTIYGDSYNFMLPGNTMGFAVNSGRLAGFAMSDYIDSLEEESI
ncbi:MAG: FAD-dependent oxidoreductase [Clostridiales bacterium]|nr:FAD-dependent oxidoreductase [Clostridiales bacterium]